MPATFINGEPGEMIPVSDRGFHYGDGVFETIRVSGRQLTLRSLHMRRLAAGCKFLHIPLQADLLEQEFQQILKSNEPEGVLKIILTRGSGGRGYHPPEKTAPLRVLQFFPLPEGMDVVREHGARVKLCDHPLSTNQHLVPFKHMCRIDQVIASRELSEAFSEGIMRTENGQVIEGTRSNLFIATDTNLLTASLEVAGVRGVMREYLLDRFTAQGTAVREQKLDLSDLLSASEVFLCNSVFGVWPVTEMVNGNKAKKFQIGHFAETAIGIANAALTTQA
ncbi:MAG: aminodeoxychorismate lyase [Gammaproteobacteria bacterium]|nr:aminodeoxychorismate lyase [Gammaproteobacteria bacterium]